MSNDGLDKRHTKIKWTEQAQKKDVQRDCNTCNTPMTTQGTLSMGLKTTTPTYPNCVEKLNADTLEAAAPLVPVAAGDRPEVAKAADASAGVPSAC